VLPAPQESEMLYNALFVTVLHMNGERYDAMFKKAVWGSIPGLSFLNEACWRLQPKLIPPLFQEALSGM